MAQLADVELHVTHTRITNEPDAPHLSMVLSGSLENLKRSTLNYPDFLVTDLDPYIYSGKEPPGFTFSWSGASPTITDVPMLC